jgi:glycine cleavage system H lipoate-binding protein
MKGGSIMENNVYEFKKRTADGEEKRSQRRQSIDIDQPFNYSDVASVTGSEYVRHLNRDGVAFLPNEELKRNAVGYLLKDMEMPTVTKVSGFRVADNYYHHIGHSWAHLLRGGWIRVGIDDFTSRVFGPAHTVHLPAVGDFLQQGDIGWTMNRNGFEAPMQSPVSGMVFAVNDRIKEHPELTHKDPYGDGWLFILNPVSLEINKKALCSGKECFQWMEQENQNLFELLGPRYQRLAATGGEPVDDIFGHFPEIDWGRLVKTFLRTG